MKRNSNIDILKFICAVMVVFLHCETPLHFYYLPITRSAVPTFFIISGFLMFTETDLNQKLRKAIRHIFKILLWSTCLFAIIKLVFSIRNSDFNFLSINAIKDFLIFNENPFGFHLWYLSAYIYVLVIVFYLRKINQLKILFFIFPLLLMTDLIFGKYSLVLLGKEYPYIYVRNFLCVGIPYFTIGMLLKRNIKKLQLIKNIQKISFCGILLFIFTSYLELTILESLSVNATRDHYLSTTFLSVSLSIFFFTSKQIPLNKIAKLGESDSLYIYIFHPLFMIAFPFIDRHLLNNFMITHYYNYFNPILILVTTIVFTKIIRRFKFIH